MKKTYCDPSFDDAPRGLEPLHICSDVGLYPILESGDVGEGIRWSELVKFPARSLFLVDSYFGKIGKTICRREALLQLFKEKWRILDEREAERRRPYQPKRRRRRKKLVMPDWLLL